MQERLNVGVYDAPLTITEVHLVAMPMRVMLRHRRSRRDRWCASQTVAACKEKPSSRASSGLYGVSSSGGTLYRVRALRPA